MHHMRASRLRSNRIALNDGDPSASPPALQIPALALDTLPESPRDASLQSNGPSPSSSPSFQPPLHRVPPTILMPHPVSRNTDGTVLHAYESFGHAQVNGPGGASGAIGESAQRDAQNVQRTNSSSTVASGGHTDSPTAIVVSPPGMLSSRQYHEALQCWMHLGSTAVGSRLFLSRSNHARTILRCVHGPV